MRVRGTPLEEAEGLLGPSGELEVTFLLVPMATFKMIQEQAQKEGCTGAQVFEKALLQYLRNVDQARQEADQPRRVPDLVVRRKRRT